MNGCSLIMLRNTKWGNVISFLSFVTIIAQLKEVYSLFSQKPYYYQKFNHNNEFNCTQKKWVMAKSEK